MENGWKGCLFQNLKLLGCNSLSNDQNLGKVDANYPLM